MNVETLKSFVGIETRGRIGRGKVATQCGDARLGEACLSITVSGLVGFMWRGQQRFRAYAWPRYTLSEAQAVFRQKFKDAKTAWAALSSEQKNAWERKRKAIKWGSSAENLFEKGFLLS